MASAFGRCHITRMATTFTITPGGKGFSIEKTDHDGSRAIIERVASEHEALRRLRALREQAEAVEMKSAMRGRRGQL